ncbi:12333_t:CDS:2, partial [Funneliformis geosporum]
ETENVKDFYNKLAKDAKSLYMENKTVQFDSTVSAKNSSGISSSTNPYYNEMNLIACYQRHISLLERLNNNLFDLLESTQ